MHEYESANRMNMTMITKTSLALSAALLHGAASAVSAGAPPNLDIQKICRASEAVPFADKTATFDICVSDELEARENLGEDWANVPATDKAHCVLPAEYLPGYLEWLTCLEMDRDFRKIRQQKLGEEPARVPSGARPSTTHAKVSQKRQ
jgi:hypothetical protein